MASPLLLRSRASIRAVSMSLRSSKSSMHEPQLSPPSSCRRSPVASSKRRGCCAPSCCLVSMLPLHAAVASARLNSLLSAEPQSWGWVPQGISMPL
ncbi:hypothetical protein MUK42_07441 [Musa troglodytarum]|uniref:Uncharacterized protein n=1 Tax=Musa troglodytarum TaxID=320322 RepID=A0A9E7GWW7_9LILI|nr:hypothetical protein MUK42_07441 [Musa troglodytarum]